MTPGQIRRAANRLAQLGILESFEVRDTMYRFVTTAGDVTLVPLRSVEWFLRGLAQGQFAEQQR